ncbi:MAG: 3-isopropylmalate dehydratase large subunit [Patescibacteria group bacterium]
MSKTLYDKIWDAHVVREAPKDPAKAGLTGQAPNEPAIIYIDLHLIHEVTSPQAFAGLKTRGMRVRRPDLTFATMDHAVPSRGRFERVWKDGNAQKQVNTLEENCRAEGITLYGLESDKQGIVHVIGPELGLTQPGMTIVCGDSHTSSHGAFGALAFGIGTSEVEQVFATQCLLQKKTKTMAITITGELPRGVYAKDIILSIIRRIGVGGGVGYTLEYRGNTIEKLSMEERLTVCNMSIEAGARAGMIAPDQTTVDYLLSKISFPTEESKRATIATWLSFRGDSDAAFDREVKMDASEIEPMVTWGINPGMSVKVSEHIPDDTANPEVKKALDYMGMQPGQRVIGQRIDYVFIGSCTNARIEDLRVAAQFLKGGKIAAGRIVYVVPGSQSVKKQAEAEGLKEIFENAGCEWRDPGCSMCIAMNGDVVPPGKYCASTSNRNFIGRQGQGARTLLMSPAMAAVAAIEGKVTDVRKYIQ